MAATFQATTPEIAGLEKERAAETQALTERLGPLESQKNTAFQELNTATNAPMPERPQLQPIPTYKPAELSQETMVNFGSLAMAFAALAGMRTRQPLTAAMNAAGAAMNGFSQGNVTQVKQDLEVFRAQSANVLATNRQMMEEYNAILNDRRMNFAEKQARWRAAADTWGDEITKGLLRVGSLDKAIQLQQHRLDAQNSWEQNARNTQAMLDARYAEMAQRAGLAREQRAQNERLSQDRMLNALELQSLRNEATAAKAEGKAGTQRFAFDNSVSNMDRMIKLAQEIRDNPALWRITGVVGVVPDAPGSEAADLRAKFDTLKSQIGFNVLQSMRDASKTGGALGQISERENVYLQQNIAPLVKIQSEDATRNAMQEIIDYGEGVKRRITSAYEMDQKGLAKIRGEQPTPQTQKPNFSPQDIVNELRRRGVVQ